MPKPTSKSSQPGIQPSPRKASTALTQQPKDQVKAKDASRAPQSPNRRKSGGYYDFCTISRKTSRSLIMASSLGLIVIIALTSLAIAYRDVDLNPKQRARPFSDDGALRDPSVVDDGGKPVFNLKRQCERMIPKTIANGWVRMESSNIEVIYTFECVSQARLKGKSRMVCYQENGEAKITSAIPLCEVIFCATPLPINREAVTAYIVGTTITFSCEDGFQLYGYETITCTLDGSWDSSVPTCQEKRCLSVSLANGRVFGRNAIGEQITYMCDPGYELEYNVRVSVCVTPGFWRPSPPKCIYTGLWTVAPGQVTRPRQATTISDKPESAKVSTIASDAITEEDDLSTENGTAPKIFFLLKDNNFDLGNSLYG